MRSLQQFCQGSRMAFAMLPHIESREVEAKNLHLAYQYCKLPLRYLLFSIRQQTLLYKQQIIKQFFSRPISNRRLRGPQPFPYERELAPVGFQGSLQTQLPIIVWQKSGITIERVFQFRRNRTILE